MANELSQSDWRERSAKHHERLAPFAQERLARQFAHIKHPVNDFLFQYYSYRPAELLRWSPGPDVLLEAAQTGDIAWREFTPIECGLILPSDSLPDHRRDFLQWAIGYFEGIAARPASFHCFGMHEWAMVYRAPEIRHRETPLRVSAAEVARLVENEGIRCTHFDAYRFFTSEAVPLNRIALTRANTDQHDQKGCIHVTMDLYKYAYKLAPWVSGELIADAFLLAWEARQIDMRASPYDLQHFGLTPIPMETQAGREEYVNLQRDLAVKAEPIRQRLIDAYRLLFQSKSLSPDCKSIIPSRASG
jgi:hypothetical protein